MSKNRILGNLDRPLRLTSRPDEELTTTEYTGSQVDLTYGVAFGIAAGLPAGTDNKGNVLESQQDTLKAHSVWKKLWDAYNADEAQVSVTAEEIEVLRGRVHRRWNAPQIFALLDEELDIAKEMTPEKAQKKAEREADEGGGE